MSTASEKLSKYCLEKFKDCYYTLPSPTYRLSHKYIDNKCFYFCTIILINGRKYTSQFGSCSQDEASETAAKELLDILQKEVEEIPTESDLDRAKNELQEYYHKTFCTRGITRSPAYIYREKTDKNNRVSFYCQVALPCGETYEYMHKGYASKNEASKHAAYTCLKSLKEINDSVEKSLPYVQNITTSYVPPSEQTNDPQIQAILPLQAAPSFAKDTRRPLFIIFIDELPVTNDLLAKIKILQERSYVNFVCEDLEEYKCYEDFDFIKCNPDMDLSVFFAVLYPSLVNNQKYSEIIVFTDELETKGQIEKMKRHIHGIASDNPTLMPFNSIEKKDNLFHDLKIQGLNSIPSYF